MLLAADSGLFRSIRIASATIIVLFTTFMVYTFAQSLEREIYPVVGDLVVTKKQAVSTTTTRIWIRFTKYRQCPPIEVSWYRGKRNGVFDQALFVIEKNPGEQLYVNSPLGIQNSGPWLLGMPIDEIETNSFAEAEHKCNPLWTTLSRFYN